MKAYLEISVEKELPKEEGVYFTLTSRHDQSKGLRKFEYGRFDDGLRYNSIAWLREFSLPELMEELQTFKDKKYPHKEGKEYVYSINGHKFLASEEFVINDFLTQKGIL